MKFKPGDRVMYIEDGVEWVEEGEVGTVVYIEKPDLLWVNWDKYKSMRHSCEGKCKSGHGCNVRARRVELCVVDLGDVYLEQPSLLDLFS